MLYVYQGGIFAQSHVFLKGGLLKPSHTVTKGLGVSQIGKNSVTYFVNGFNACFFLSIIACRLSLKKTPQSVLKNSSNILLQFIILRTLTINSGQYIRYKYPFPFRDGPLNLWGGGFFCAARECAGFFFAMIKLQDIFASNRAWLLSFNCTIVLQM